MALADTLKKIKEQFIEHMATSPPTWTDARLVLDTCVVGEIDTGGDLLRLAQELGSAEAALASTRWRYRQHRARHSLILGYWLAKNRTVTGMVGAEALTIVMGKLAPIEAEGAPMDPATREASYALTTAITQVLWEGPLREWRRGALREVDHDAEHGRVDDEILRVASETKATVVTWEGFSEHGIEENPHKLRDRCRAAGVEVFTPEEYLAHLDVDVPDAARRFVFATEKAIREARARGVLAGKDVMEFIGPWFRLVLLDEVNPGLAHIQRPRWPT